MLNGMDTIVASYVLYVKVGTFTHLEQSKISLLTVNKSGIGIVTIQHDMIASIIFNYYPGDYLIQTSADVISLELPPSNI
jgi:hypothetical protein